MSFLTAQLLACEIALGRRQHGAKAWEITLSTLPGRQGQSLFEVHGALRRTAAGVYEQHLPDGAARRVWRQVERGLARRRTWTMQRRRRVLRPGARTGIAYARVTVRLTSSTQRSESSDDVP